MGDTTGKTGTEIFTNNVQILELPLPCTLTLNTYMVLTNVSPLSSLVANSVWAGAGQVCGAYPLSTSATQTYAKTTSSSPPAPVTSASAPSHSTIPTASQVSAPLSGNAPQPEVAGSSEQHSRASARVTLSSQSSESAGRWQSTTSSSSIQQTPAPTLSQAQTAITSSLRTSPASATEGAKAGPTPTNVVSVAGGVVGGLAVLLLVLLALLWLRRKRYIRKIAPSFKFRDTIDISSHATFVGRFARILDSSHEPEEPPSLTPKLYDEVKL